MNRRNFLKSIAAACGAAVVCPGELLKGPIKFRPNPVQRVYMIDHPIFHNTIYIMHDFSGRRSGFIITRPT